MAEIPERQKRPQRRSRGGLNQAGIAIDFVILADFAQAVQGKLYLMGGGWTLHHARQYPSAVTFGLGIGVLVPWAETNRQHTLEFLIVKSEGAELARGEGQFAVGRDVTTPVGMTQRVTVGISGQIEIPEPGTYEVIVRIPEAEKRVSFEALPLQQIPYMPAPPSA